MSNSFEQLGSRTGPIDFSGIDAQVKQNLKRVLSAFRCHRVGHTIASVSGYGHDDLGRQTLDQVFACVMQAGSGSAGAVCFRDSRDRVLCLVSSGLGMKC